MMAEPHYDEEALIALLEAGDDSLSRDPHIATCTACTKMLASVREIADCLKAPDVWDTTEISPDPNPNVLAFLDRAQSDMRAEDAAAEPWLRELLAQPREAWSPTLHAHPEWRTAGMVRKLIGASYRAIETMPPDAVEMTSMAVDIAESLSPGCYGEPTVLRTRGHAWREQAYALYFTGLYNEAITAVERARKAFAECGYSEFDEARAAVVFALICAEQENFAAGLAAAHAAADVFARYDTRAKIVAARRTEGITLYLLRRFREALTIYHALEAETITATERGAILQNIALCYRELGEFEAAGRYFAAAMDLFAKAGFVTAIAKSRWHFGRVLLAQGRYAEALDTLHQVREEFVTSNMTHDVAEVTTDIAHAMVVMGRPRDVADECRRALTYFASAGLTMTEPAMSAISLLQESAANDRLDARAVGEIRLRVVHSRPATIHLQVN